jgi:hypothetical protein
MDAQKARRIRKADGAGGAQGGIFAERMAGDEHGVGNVGARFGFEDAHDGDRVGHQGGLRIGGEGQFLHRPLAHQLRELPAEGLIDLLEHFAGGLERIGEARAHADRLTALSRKYVSARHRGPAPLTIQVTLQARGHSDALHEGQEQARFICAHALTSPWKGEVENCISLSICSFRVGIRRIEPRG